MAKLSVALKATAVDPATSSFLKRQYIDTPETNTKYPSDIHLNSEHSYPEYQIALKDAFGFAPNFLSEGFIESYFGGLLIRPTARYNFDPRNVFLGNLQIWVRPKVTQLFLRFETETGANKMRDFGLQLPAAKGLLRKFLIGPPRAKPFPSYYLTNIVIDTRIHSNTIEVPNEYLTAFMWELQQATYKLSTASIAR